MKPRPYVLYWEEMNEVEEEREEDITIPNKMNIICHNCRDRVGYVKASELEVPMNGTMIHPHPGCESWPIPNKWDKPQDFVCPHANFDGGDKHLFIPLNNNNPEESSLLMLDNHKMFDIRSIVGNCPCGCGRLVPDGNKYADGIRCFNRLRQTEKRDG